MSTDVDALLLRSARLEVGDIDFAAFAERPLGADALRCLRYMHDVEHHTVCYLRDLLVTRVHRDPEVTAFLACWSYEELWHGRALSRVLEAHGEPGGTRVAGVRRGLPRRDALRPLVFAAASFARPDVVAVHMAWGAVNELTTQSGYARLAARAGHPVLSDLLHRIMRQEGRHIDFYASQATARLAGNRAAQRLARMALRRLWGPVGSGLMPRSEVAFLADYLFAGASGVEAARRVDRHIDHLPGLGGLQLLERAVGSGHPALGSGRTPRTGSGAMRRMLGPGASGAALEAG